jgi:signal transduction histidine kinase
MALVITRYLGSHGVRREQLRWMVAAAGVLGLSLAIAAVVTFAYPGDRLATEAAMALTSLGMLAIATAAAIAILRHRLYGIDVLLDRTLVYASLTAAVLALYLLVVGAVGALAGPQDNLLVALVATGLVAALVLPLRDRLQHGVNRLMYGERDDPHALLSRLGRRLEATAAPDTVLVTVAESVARALRLPYAAVALRYDEGSETAAAYGRSAGPLLAFPITHGDERVGELLVAPRPGETTLSDAERPLLETIARQAGVAAHGVRLTTDLRRSRERLVASREEERRRMRRDLHDGLGPALAAMALKVEAARNYLAGTGGPAPELLSQLAEEIDQAAAGIRRLMYGLRPPALDDLGLVGALRVQAGLHEGPELRIEVCAPEALPPLPAAVEVAAYRISQEALTNVVRHAHAGHCRVTLEVDERLCLTVEDDGRGLPSRVRTGVGLRSIRERATELGGSVDIATRRSSGTRVSAWIPLGEGA